MVITLSMGKLFFQEELMTASRFRNGYCKGINDGEEKVIDGGIIDACLLNEIIK